MFNNFSVAYLSGSSLELCFSAKSSARWHSYVDVRSESKSFHFVYSSVLSPLNLRISRSTFSRYLDNPISLALSSNVYTSSQSISSDTSITQCIFINCTSSSSGGAIYVGGTIHLTVSDSVFINCSASAGGAIYATSASYFGVARVCTLSCSANVLGPALYFYPCTSANISMLSVSLSFLTSASGGETCTFGSYYENLTNLNISSSINIPSTASCLIAVFTGGYANFDYANIFNNTSPTICLSLRSADPDYANLGDTNIVSNKASGAYLISLQGGTKHILKNSIIQGNTFLYMVGYISGWPVSGVTFVNCKLDVAPTASNVTFSSTSCQIGAATTIKVQQMTSYICGYRSAQFTQKPGDGALLMRLCAQSFAILLAF